MDARTTRRQLLGFAVTMLVCLGFFVWLLGPWGPKTVEPYNPADHPPAPTVVAPVKMEVHKNRGYECLRVAQGEKDLHWQCFKAAE
jgi:hypothetical protein